MTRADSSNEIILGWRVNRGLDPEYWLRPGARAGKHRRENLLAIPASSVANHTAIVAQSGSGKSFFLGRLVEEIVIKTKARCLILDPNGDFLQVNELADSRLWKNAKYNINNRLGFLPTEESQDKFAAEWSVVSLLRRSSNTALAGEPFELPWASLPSDFLTSDLPPLLASEVHHCHRLIQAISELSQGRLLDSGEEVNLLDEGERILSQQDQIASEAAVQYQKQILERQYRVKDLIARRVRNRIMASEEQLRMLFPERQQQSLLPRNEEASIYRTIEEERIQQALDLASRLPRYISKEAERIYFARARRYEEGKIFSTLLAADEAPVIEPTRLDIVDLASIGAPQLRRLVVSSLIATEFERLRQAWHHAITGSPESDLRIPTFLVVDEAHNLIPNGTVDKEQAALREQFRTIAAEGRKFGFFLILVTQRPDKLDSLVVSECENRVVMKLGSQSVLRVTKEMLGLEDLSSRVLEKCLEFDAGRGLVYGNWSVEGPAFFYSAARRTKEGGRNLRSDHWATPYIRGA